MAQSLNRSMNRRLCYDFLLGIYTFLVDQSWRITVMRKSWLVCVLLGTLAWGQGAESAPPPQPAQGPGANQQTPVDTSASVPNDAAVLTITGVCPSQGQAPAANASADCKTVIPTAEFNRVPK